MRLRFVTLVTFISGIFALVSPCASIAQSRLPPLTGTGWQLVKFQGADGKTRMPDLRSKYTVRFGGGQLTITVDCNRGRGPWKWVGPNKVEFGPLALTRAQCPAGSLHDQIVKQWPSIRSYLLKDGHLFLSVVANGGTYEFEQISNA